ncbi:hypothetical protein QUF70_08210 [Desulfobacterales bacterium HSG17]|nr:hypothetical protein [Desulfobacterales bacterium HSG17]
METNKTGKKESEFYIAKTIDEAKEKIETRVKSYNEKIKSYNEKYVKNQIEKGREFITELKADPVKTIDDLIYDSFDAFNKVQSTRKETVQKKVDTTKKDVRERIEKINKKTGQVYKGLENDAKLIFEDIIELGKKNLDRIPMKKNIEKIISEKVDSIPSKLKLPSKAEIENLVIGIDGVNKKVDALNKQYAGA